MSDRSCRDQPPSWPIRILDHHGTDPRLGRFLDLVAMALWTSGLEASWSRSAPDAFDEQVVYVAHDPVAPPRSPGIHLFGQRLLNRRQRLQIASRLGLAVVPWSSPCSLDCAMGLFDLWETRHILWKRDESFSRKGVRPVTRAELPGLDFEAGADVFMPILQTDPATIKVDAFFDRVIAARRFDTKSVFDPRFHQTVATVEWLDLPAPLTEELAALGVVLASYGCAYWSADLMAWNGGLGIIELNTCSVGRKLTWPFAERLYLRGYCSGLKRLVGHSDPCCLGEALERVRRLDEEHRCPCS